MAATPPATATPAEARVQRQDRPAEAGRAAQGNRLDDERVTGFTFDALNVTGERFHVLSSGVVLRTTVGVTGRHLVGSFIGVGQLDPDHPLWAIPEAELAELAAGSAPREPQPNSGDHLFLFTSEEQSGVPGGHLWSSGRVTALFHDLMLNRTN
jgi:hypothetical protein